MSTEGKFKVNTAENQYEYHVGEHMAFLEYIKEPDKIFFTHTEAPEELKGTGAAAKLVESALQHAKDNNLAVVPSCTYVANYINKHPEWYSVLSEGYQM